MSPVCRLAPSTRGGLPETVVCPNRIPPCERHRSGAPVRYYAMEISKEQRAAVAESITRLERDFYGRGPTSVRVSVSNGDPEVITALSIDRLTAMDRTLADRGMVAQVVAHHQAVHQATSSEFCGEVEKNRRAGARRRTWPSSTRPPATRCACSSSPTPPKTDPRRDGFAEARAGDAGAALPRLCRRRRRLGMGTGTAGGTRRSEGGWRPGSARRSRPTSAGRSRNACTRSAHPSPAPTGCRFRRISPRTARWNS